MTDNAQPGVEQTTPANMNEAKEKFLKQISDWMDQRDNRPAKLTITHMIGMTPQGPGRVFQIHMEQLIGQVTELQEQPRIVPANGVPPGFPGRG